MLKKIRLDIAESLKGTEQDYTRIPIGKAIFLLAIPMIIEMIMESVFAVVDIFFVSQLGADAVSAVGISESIMTLVYAIGVGLGTATTAMVSRRIGEKRKDDAAFVGTQSIILGIIGALPVLFAGIFFAKEILTLMGGTEEISSDGYVYTRILLASSPVIMLLFVVNAIFRSAGDAILAMKVLWVANMLNMILDPCLIFGWGPFPELGLEGAAWATFSGRTIAVVYQFYLLSKPNNRIRIEKRHIIFIPNIIKKLIKLSIGGIGQSLIATSSWIILVRIIAIFGANVLAGYTIAIRVLLFTLLPAWGISTAASTLVGQNLGAGHPDRAEKTVWKTAWVNTTFLGITAILFIAFASEIIGWFSNDPTIIEEGIDCLRIVSYGYLSYAFGMILSRALNGAGDTKTPTLINFIAFWIIEIPLAYFLAIVLEYNETGVYYSIVIAETILAIIAFFVFKNGKWKFKKV